MLDITDNIVDGAVRHPDRTVCPDGDDAYLVVAADKGTAKFSDLANSVAAEYGFWLGDAFASGGSAGYDHKAMGITARGAWLSVRRHFAEAGRDIDVEPFTVAGIGDMSGDVFGNGMLLSTTSNWSPPSTTGTSSSIPTRTRGHPSASVHGCSICPPRAGRTTTPR